MAEPTMSPAPLTALDETLRAAQEIARLQGDSFRVKVQRRGPQGPPVGVATFDDARLEHISTPEVWMPNLVGGGVFQLMIYELNENSRGSKPVGVPIPITLRGDPRDPDPRMVTRSDWRGPPTMIFPTLPTQQRVPEGMSMAGPTAESPQRPATQDLYAVTAAAGREAEAARELARKEKVLADERAAFERDQIRKVAEGRVKEADERVRAIEIKSEQERRELAQRIERVESNKESVIEKAIATLAPTLLELIQSSRSSASELQIAQIKAQAEVAKAQAEAQVATMKLQLEAQQRADDRFTTILTKVTERPKEGAGVAEMQATMIQGQTAMQQMMLNLVSAMVDMGLGGRGEEQPSQTVQVVNAITRGLAMLAKSGKRAPAPTNRQLAGHQQQEETPADEDPPDQVSDSEPQEDEPEEEQEATMSVLDELIQMIADKTPVAQVSNFVIENAADADLGKAFEAANGELDKVLATGLPKGWNDVLANRQYLASFVGDFIPRAVKSGIIPPESMKEVAKIQAKILGGPKAPAKPPVRKPAPKPRVVDVKPEPSKPAEVPAAAPVAPEAPAK